MEKSYSLWFGDEIAVIFSGPGARKKAEWEAANAGKVPGRVTVRDADSGSIVWTKDWRADD